MVTARPPHFAAHRRLKAIPDQPGIYQFFDAQGSLLYVGKANNLKKRVASYFRRPEALSERIAQMVRAIVDVQIQPTASEAEALLLEARLIKEKRPRYNVIFRDDKTYPMLKITNEPFPRLLKTRRKLNDGALYFGPYTEAGLMNQAIEYFRKVFPLRTCRTFPKTPCLEYHLGQCLAPCANYINEAQYKRIVSDLAAFLQGKRSRLLKDLSQRMHRAARHRRYEEAARLRDQIQALTSVITAKEKSLSAGPLEQLQAALKLAKLPRRIEGFDISNIFGQDAVGSMVTFVDGKPFKSHYRHFAIQRVQGIDDFRMMAEVVLRRYSGSLSRSLPLPDLILVDGGKGQLGAASSVLSQLKLSIPIIGLAKRYEQIFVPDARDPIALLPTSPVLHLIQHVRDEAHRFAITYHRTIRQRASRRSLLDAVSGIGPERKRRLLRYFKSLRELSQAPVEEIARAGKMPKPLAAAVLEHLRQQQGA